MARNGFKIFDADTHVRPDADLLQPYLDVDMRAKLNQFDRYKPRTKKGQSLILWAHAIISAGSEPPPRTLLKTESI